MDRHSRQRTINFNQRLNDGNGPAMAGRLNNEFYQRRPRIPTVQDLIERKRRRERRLLRRKVISAGWKANILNAIGLLATAALFLAHFTHLQADADYKLFYPEIVFPHIVNRDVIPNIIHNGHWLSGIAFLLHLIAIKVSKTRFNFSSLLALIIWPVLIFLHFEGNHSPDYLICRMPISMLAVVVYTMIVFLPKKLKHRKKPNTFSSAFSTASTPVSQVSSNYWFDDRSVGTQPFDTRTTIDDDELSLCSFRSARSNGTILSQASRNDFKRRRPVPNLDGIGLRTGERSKKTMNTGNPAFLEIRDKLHGIQLDDPMSDHQMEFSDDRDDENDRIFPYYN